MTLSRLNSTRSPTCWRMPSKQEVKTVYQAKVQKKVRQVRRAALLTTVSTEGNEPSHLQTFRSRFRSDSGNESQSSDVSPTPPLEEVIRKSDTFVVKQFLLWQPCLVKYEGRVKDRRALEMRASTLRGDMRMLRAELSQLKQFQTFQAQQFQEMIRNAKEQIVQRVTRINNADDKSEKRKVQAEEMVYIRGKNDINRHISELESEVEMVRLDVVQKRCIGNPAEVNSLNSQLSIISRQVSDLKSEFAELHDNMKSIMASELEVIVQGDKFLKEEPAKLENLVCRCKHITGTLFTLQKLVSAQQQMKSESEASFSSLEDVDKEVIDSIRSVQREYLTKRSLDHKTTEKNTGKSNPEMDTAVQSLSKRKSQDSVSREEEGLPVVSIPSIVNEIQQN
ncbi:Actin interacting protein 3 [Desmophyllum pertusum]|uniref:Actin interacting protein 3 n=1 Tax=Desmophyllum pertusum TaxID=174260 RepID=A0A9W9ZXS6_9CNID|nr:Actin interacting protein 3 [Desmophyllum pertusum]